MRFLAFALFGLFVTSAHALDLQIAGAFDCADWEISGSGAAICHDVVFLGSVSNGVHENELLARILYNPAIATAMCVSVGYSQAIDAQAVLWNTGGLRPPSGQDWIVTLSETLEVTASKWRPSNGTPYFSSLTCE